MIKPIGAMLLVKKIESGEKTTKTGIVLTASFADIGPRQGEIIDMGDGEANYKGEVIPIHGVSIGDTVYFPEHGGTDIEDEDGNKFILMHSKNVIAKKS
jgi:co-chaperonin GroES (HSP10)